jgi:ABC-type cobalamin/Fe3+-siderophores transport system ATPase subunit
MIQLVSDTLQYQGVKLQNPHHITIPRGITAIIGPNGSGKSTLGLILEKGWNICTNRLKGEADKMTIRSIEFYDIHTLAGL